MISPKGFTGHGLEVLTSTIGYRIFIPTTLHFLPLPVENLIENCSGPERESLHMPKSMIAFPPLSYVMPNTALREKA